jgi:hypothetical protein
VIKTEEKEAPNKILQSELDKFEMKCEMVDEMCDTLGLVLQ